MSAGPKTKRTRKLIILAALGLAILGLVPLPFGITSSDRESAVSHAMDALYGGRKVIANEGYGHLQDTAFVKNTGRVYFGNHLDIPDTVFLKHGLKPIPKDRKLKVDKGDVVISFANRDPRDVASKPLDNIQFSYVFGSLGAQFYEIRIYKSFLLRYFVFVHVGES